MTDPTIVYAVEYGEYSDYTVESLWSTQAKAEERAAKITLTNYGPASVVERRIDPTDLAEERVVHVGVVHIAGGTGDPIRKWSGFDTVFFTTSLDAEPLGVQLRRSGAVGSLVWERNEWTLNVRAETDYRARKVLSEQLAQIKARVDQTGPLTEESK